MTPYPGTKVYEEFVQQNRITTFDYAQYNTAHVVFQPKNMTAQQLYDGYIQIYKDIYSFKKYSSPYAGSSGTESSLFIV